MRLLSVINLLIAALLFGHSVAIWADETADNSDTSSTCRHISINNQSFDTSNLESVVHLSTEAEIMHEDDMGGSGFDVITEEECSWSATTNNPRWLYFPIGNSWSEYPETFENTGSSTIVYNAVPNHSPDNRRGSITITVGNVNFIHTVEQMGCEYVFTTKTAEAFSGTNTGELEVFASSELCDWTWTVNSDSDWLRLESANTGAGTDTDNGSASLTYTVDFNPHDTSRTGHFSLNEQEVFTLTQAANCEVNLESTTLTALFRGEQERIEVESVVADCQWSAHSPHGWINITDTDNSTYVEFEAVANTGITPRIGSLMIGNQTVTISQEANPYPDQLEDCASIRLDRDSAIYNADVQIATLSVELLEGCAWQAESDVDWLTIASTDQTGIGSHRLTYLVDFNDTGASRAGHISIAGTVHTVTQDFSDCFIYAIHPANPQHTGAGGLASFDIETQVHCEWFAMSDSDWLTILNESLSGRGADKIDYYLSANYTGETRVGIVTIAGQEFTVTQASQPQCVASLNPTHQHFPAVSTAAGQLLSGTIELNLAPNCEFTLDNHHGWLIFPPHTAGETPQTLTYQVINNPTPQMRSAQVNIAGTVFTVTQDTLVQAPPQPEEEPPTPQLPCTPIVTTDSITHGAGQESGIIRVEIADNCAWRVTSSEAWLVSEAPDIANSAFSYTVASNVHVEARSAEFTITAQDGQATTTIEQAAGEQQHRLTLSVLPPVGGMVEILNQQTVSDCRFSQCQFNYPADTRLNLVAHSVDGWQFNGWTNCGSETGLCIVDLNADHNISARFEQVASSHSLNNKVEPQQAGRLKVYGRLLTQEGTGAPDLSIELTVTALDETEADAEEAVVLAQQITTDEFGRYEFTGLNDFIPGQTYNVLVSAFDPQGNRIDSNNTITFPTQAFTRLSLELNSATILNNATISLTGKLSRFPATPIDLSGLEIELTVLAPDGSVQLIPLQTVTDIGQYSLTDLDGFTQSGSYTLQTSFSGTTALGAAASDPQTLLVGGSAGYVLLVQGRIANGEGLAAHNKTVQRIYQRLKNRGFKDENIIYLNYNPAQAGVDAIPSKTAIRAALNTLQQRLNGAPAPFYLIMVNHGGVGGNFYIDDGNGAQIPPAELALWLDSFEVGLSNAAFTKYPRIIMLGACYSGNFIPALSGRGRIIITSSAADEVSFKGPEEADGIRSGEFFMEELFHRLERGDSLKHAFEFATTRTEIYTRRNSLAFFNDRRGFRDRALQHPLLDDNGDRVGSNLLNVLQVGGIGQQDGQLQADSIYLGVGANFDTNFEDKPAEILSVTDTLFLMREMTAELSITVNDADRVAVAAVDIRLPSTTLSLESREYTEQLEIKDLPREFLNCDSSQRCSVKTKPIFTEPGLYEIFYFVRDSLTDAISPLQRSVVYKNHPANNPPRPFSLRAPRHNAKPQTVLLFDWSDSGDPDDDPFTYTLRIAADKQMQQVLYTHAELNRSSTFIDANTWVKTLAGEKLRGLQDQTEYFWQVSAVDIYGAQTFSRIYRFETDNPNAQPGIHTAYFDQLLNESGELAVEIIYDVEPIAVTVEQDKQLALLPPGEHKIEVTAPGFETRHDLIHIESGQMVESSVVLQPMTEISLAELELYLPLVMANQLGQFEVTLQGNSELSEFSVTTATPVLTTNVAASAEFNPDSGRLWINNVWVMETQQRYEVIMQLLPAADSMRFEVVEVRDVD